MVDYYKRDLRDSNQRWAAIRKQLDEIRENLNKEQKREENRVKHGMAFAYKKTRISHKGKV